MSGGETADGPEVGAVNPSEEERSMVDQSNKQMAQGDLAEAQMQQDSPEALGGESMQLQPITDEKEAFSA